MEVFQSLKIYTLGCDGRGVDNILDLLARYDIKTVVDVRANARASSSHQQEMLCQELEKDLVTYHWAGAQLGGQRQALTDSQNIALQQPLQAYADYMQTEQFSRAIHQLEHLAKVSVVAILAEAINPMECYRSLMADYLLLRGHEVIHLLENGEHQSHQLSPFARRESIALVYDRV